MYCNQRNKILVFMIVFIVWVVSTVNHFCTKETVCLQPLQMNAESFVMTVRGRL